MFSHKPMLGVKYSILGQKDETSGLYLPHNEDTITLKIFSKDGVLQRLRKMPMKSYVGNFVRLLNYIFLAVDNSTGGSANDKIIKAAAGGATYAASALYKADVTEGALTSPTQTAYGAWLGDRDNASGLGLTVESGIGGTVGYNDYLLRALMLADGGSPDTNMEYRAVSLSISGNTVTLSRRFQNDGAVPLYVSESGVVGKSGTDYFMLIRDVFDNVEIDATEIFEVSYTFTIDDASGFTKNYLRFLTSVLKAGNALEQVKDKLGNLYTVNFTSAATQARLNALADDDTFGILIGGSSDNLLVVNLSTDAYDVTQRLANTDLVHSAVEAIAITLNNSKVTFGLQRDFENQGSSVYNVTNSGLFIKEAAGGHYFMIAKTKVNNANHYQQVNPGQILRVQYSWEFPVAVTLGTSV